MGSQEFWLDYPDFARGKPRVWYHLGILSQLGQDRSLARLWTVPGSHVSPLLDVFIFELQSGLSGDARCMVHHGRRALITFRKGRFEQ